MSITVQWQQATKYPAKYDRAAINAMMAPGSDTTTRDGVLTVGGLTPSHTTGMSVKVGAGQAIVAGYLVTVDPAVTVTLDVGGAQRRTDLVVLRVYDEAEGDSSSEGAVEVVKGDPGGAVPATPVRSLLIAQVAVTATASTLDPGDLADERVFTTGRGGVLYLPGALQSDPPEWAGDGQAVYDPNEQAVGIRNGSKWDWLIPGGSDGVAAVSRGGTGRSSLTSGSYLRGDASGAVVSRTPAQVWDDIQGKGSTFLDVAHGGTGRYLWSVNRYLRSNGDGTVIDQYTPAQVLDDIGAAAYQVVNSGNWNTIMRTGVYYVTGSSNGPNPGTYVALVAASGSVVGQVAWNLAAGQQFNTYHREYVGGAWANWVKVGGDTGWLDCTFGGGITGKVYAKVLNGVVYFKGEVGATDGTQIGVLPSGIPKPSAEVARLIHFRVISNQPNPVRVRVDTSGRLWVHGDDVGYSFEGLSYAVPS